MKNKFFNLNSVMNASERELRKMAENDPEFTFDEAENMEVMSLRIAMLENRNDINRGLINKIAKT